LHNPSGALNCKESDFENVLNNEVKIANEI